MTDEIQQPDSVTATSSATLRPGAFNTRPAPVASEPAQPADTAAGDALNGTVDAQQQEQTQDDADADFQDGTFFDESAQPGRYSFDRVAPGIQHSPQQEVAARTLFAAEQVPAEVGRYLSTVWNKAAAAGPQTPEANAAAAERVTAQLTRMDPAQGAETIKLAQQEVEAIAKRTPAVREWLEQSGMGNDPFLINYLANRARARANRAARRGK